MSKLIFLLSLIALLVGCTQESASTGPQPGYQYDPAVVGETPAPEPMAASPATGSDVDFVETDDPTMLQTPSDPGIVYEQSSPATYVVKQGDTFYGIAVRELGSGRRWQEIAALNPQVSATKLPIGAQIKLPN